MMSPRRCVAAVFAEALVVTACGGDDGADTAAELPADAPTRGEAVAGDIGAAPVDGSTVSAADFVVSGGLGDERPTSFDLDC